MTFAWWNLGSQAGRPFFFGVFLTLGFLPVCAGLSPYNLAPLINFTKSCPTSIYPHIQLALVISSSIYTLGGALSHHLWVCNCAGQCKGNGMTHARARTTFIIRCWNSHGCAAQASLLENYIYVPSTPATSQGPVNYERLRELSWNHPSITRTTDLPSRTLSQITVARPQS